MAILVVVCGKMCGKMCGKIEKLLYWNKNWCGSRYGPCDYDSGDKKTTKIVVKFVVKCVVKCVVKLLDCNKNWCGSRYGPHDYDSGDKKNKKLLQIRQKGRGPKGPPCPLQS